MASNAYFKKLQLNEKESFNAWNFYWLPASGNFMGYFDILAQYIPNLCWLHVLYFTK